MVKYTLFSNYDTEKYEETARGILTDMHEEVCEEDELEDYTPDEEELYNLTWELCNQDWEDMYYYLCKATKDKACIFYGTIGAWDNDYEGGQIGAFEDLFPKATEDCMYWEIATEDGELKLRCSHHDGTNYFTIKIVTEGGMNYYDEWNYYNVDNDLNLEEVHKKIIENFTEDIKIDF